MNLTNKDIDMKDYPNALAHIKVHPQEKMIEVVETVKKFDDSSCQDINMKKERKTKKSRSKNFSKNTGVEAIWKHMSSGNIDISYACVGYSYDGRPILDYTAFVDLLANYGFKIEDSLAFIDDFASCAYDDDKAPIVMTNINTARIMTEIKKIA